MYRTHSIYFYSYLKIKVRLENLLFNRISDPYKSPLLIYYLSNKMTIINTHINLYW